MKSEYEITNTQNLISILDNVNVDIISNFQLSVSYTKDSKRLSGWLCPACFYRAKHSQQADPCPWDWAHHGKGCQKQ